MTMKKLLAILATTLLLCSLFAIPVGAETTQEPLVYG